MNEQTNPAPPMPPAPWEQQPDEPSEAYARFLAYRNLGPGRSIDLAYRVHESKGNKRSKAPGNWRTDSSEYRWKERATKWDISILQSQGEQAVVNFINLLVRTTEAALQSLADGSVKPRDWRDVSTTIENAAKFITPDLVALVATQATPPTASDGGGQATPG